MATRDDYGQPQSTWQAVGQYPCALIESRLAETAAGEGQATRTTRRRTFLLPGDADVRETDRITHEGQVYDIVAVRYPTTWGSQLLSVDVEG